MELTQVDDPWGTPDCPPAWYVEHQRLIAACAARPGGHAWTVQGEPEEQPGLYCADCPGVGDDAYPDIADLLNGQVHELGGRTIRFGENLPDGSDAFVIPVHLDVETVKHASPDWIGFEYDVEVQITDRETVA